MLVAFPIMALISGGMVLYAFNNSKDPYGKWLNDQKGTLNKIGDNLIKLSDKTAVEAKLKKLVDDGSDVMILFVGFSDNTLISNIEFDWSFVNVTERPWYKLAMTANGDIIETELYEDPFDGSTIITIAKNIGTINGLDAVLGADLTVPEGLLNKPKKNETLPDGSISTQIKETSINDYENWIKAQKIKLDDIGTDFVNSNSREYIENYISTFSGDNMNLLYAVFSDDTIVINADWEPPSGMAVALRESEWYKNAIAANGNTAEIEIYESSFGDRIMTISKHIGEINGFDTVIAADLVVPDTFF